jgi:hypothetical protein
MLVVYPMVYYITHSDIRYRHLIDPEIVLLAVYAFTALREPAAEAEAVGWVAASAELAETLSGSSQGGTKVL